MAGSVVNRSTLNGAALNGSTGASTTVVVVLSAVAGLVAHGTRERATSLSLVGAGGSSSTPLVLVPTSTMLSGIGGSSALVKRVSLVQGSYNGVGGIAMYLSPVVNDLWTHRSDLNTLWQKR